MKNSEKTALNSFLSEKILSKSISFCDSGIYILLIWKNLQISPTTHCNVFRIFFSNIKLIIYIKWMPSGIIANKTSH